MVRLLNTRIVKGLVKDLKKMGCEVKEDYSAGTVVVKDGEHEVFKALQKGNGQPWIVRLMKTQKVTWEGWQV